MDYQNRMFSCCECSELIFVLLWNTCPSLGITFDSDFMKWITVFINLFVIMIIKCACCHLLGERQ